MSFEKEIQISPGKAAESFDEPNKHSKISYTRDFLLTLSELDACKTFPSGFDRSLLSEFEDAYYGMQDPQRIPSLPLQSYRLTEHRVSPPTRGDSSNYSRGTCGRWDTQNSGRNERDSDSQSDKDSDSGRRYGNNLSRRSWQSPERDGLLGSGSFSRPSGYAAGLSAPKIRSNDHYQLNRTNKPYHPPRPYKAVPHSRREANDSYNDETFGSIECTSQDKAEEERRRRESFELMRKEQQKARQERQKLNSDKHQDDFVSELMEDTREGKRAFNRSNGLDESVVQLASNNDSNRSSSQAPGSRPLVPPGFKSTITERNCTITSLNHSNNAEVGRPEPEESLSHDKAIVQNGTSDNQEGDQLAQKIGFTEQHHEKMGTESLSINKGGYLEVADKLGACNQPYRTSHLSEATEIQDGSGNVELHTKKVTGPKTIGNSKQNDSISILEKLFNSALTVNLGESSGSIEPGDTERDDSLNPSDVQTSKFAQWFLEDESESARDPSNSGPSDLFSLIVGGEKAPSRVSDGKSTTHVPPNFLFQGSDLTNMTLESNVTSDGILEKFYSCGTQEGVPSVLTCEDLEQSIMSEYSAIGSTIQRSNVSGVKAEEPKANIDDHASQHLLSLLRKGMNLKDTTQFSNLDVESSDKLQVSEGAIAGNTHNNHREEKVENIPHSGTTLTLETLFGSAFMKELQSVEAPVSVQRGSIGATKADISEPQGLSSVIMIDGLFPTSVGSNSGHESNGLQSTQRQESKSGKIENCLGINDTRAEVDSLKPQNTTESKLDGVDGPIDIQLPEEESLISVGDPVNTAYSIVKSSRNSINVELLFPNKLVDITEKLAALSTGFKNERPMVGQENAPFIRSPHNPMGSDIPYHSVHSQPSSSQCHPPQLNHVRSPFRPFDLHPNHVTSQMNFMASEGIIHHDAPADQQFPSIVYRSPFHHPNTGLARFDLPSNSMSLQMPMPNNFPPVQLLRESPRGGPLAHHPGSHGAGFVQEPCPMQTHPFDQRQHNFGDGFGMQLQGPDPVGGSNHPEAFQRLIEMELRAKSKQTHPFAGTGQSQGMYGYDVDMGFPYR